MGIRVAAVLVLAVAGCSTAIAQQVGCTTTTLSDPPRQILRCADGLTVSAESGAAYGLRDNNRDGLPEAIELTGKALLIDLPPGRRRGGFQILTPHAIASVRGTVWAVDVSGTRTSVFVEQGVVRVSRPRAGAVNLRAGDGVDVDAGASTLQVKRWSPQRASALLARLRP